MNTNKKIWLKGQVAEYKKQLLAESGFVVDKEHEEALLQLLIEFYESDAKEENWKALIKFVTKHFVIRPFVEQIIKQASEMAGNKDEKNA